MKTDGKTKLILSEQNINNYLRKYTNHKKKFAYDFYENKEVIKFKTKGFILDEQKYMNYTMKVIKRIKKGRLFT